MPKLKNPLNSQEARGGIDGLCYNTYRGISYVKTNTSPGHQDDPLRLEEQGILASVSALWQGIDETQRTHWNEYALNHPEPDWTGKPKRLTGHNWFCRINTRQTKYEFQLLYDPPTIPAPDAFKTFYLTKEPITNNVLYNHVPLGGDPLYYEFWKAPLMTIGRKPRWEFATRYSFTDSNNASPWFLAPPQPSGRSAWWVRVYNRETGLVSTWRLAWIDY